MQFHDISRGMMILKSEMEKMNMKYQDLSCMRDSLASQMELLRLDVKEAQNVKKNQLPTEETQTEMDMISEQQAAVSSITPPVQPASQITEYTFPEDLHNFIQTTAKLNTPYHTDDYILTIQESSSGKRILSIETKSDTATNQPIPELSQQDITHILNPQQQKPTSLQTLPGTDMVPVPSTSQKQVVDVTPSDTQPSTSQQHDFGPDAPQLPIAPPGILTHTHTSSLRNTHLLYLKLRNLFHRNLDLLKLLIWIKI